MMLKLLDKGRDANDQHPAFAPTAPQRILALDARVFALWRQGRDGSAPVLGLHNVSAESVTVQLDAIAPGGQGWKPLWGCTRRPATGGRLLLEPWGSSWLAVAAPLRQLLPTT